MWLAKINKKYKRITSDEAIDALAKLGSEYEPTDIFMLVVLGELADASQIGDAADDVDYAQIVVYSLGDILDMRYLDKIDSHPSQNVKSWGSHPIKRTLVKSAYHWQSNSDFTIIGLRETNGLLSLRRFTAKEMRRNGLSLSHEDWFWLATVLELSHPLPDNKPDKNEHGGDGDISNSKTIVGNDMTGEKRKTKVRKKKPKAAKAKRSRQRDRDRKFGLLKQLEY